MTTVLEPAPVETESGGGHEIIHYVCDGEGCDPDVAFCGKDVSDHPYDPPNGPVCIVCHELDCPTCG